MYVPFLFCFIKWISSLYCSFQKLKKKDYLIKRNIYLKNGSLAKTTIFTLYCRLINLKLRYVLFYHTLNL